MTRVFFEDRMFATGVVVDVGLWEFFECDAFGSAHILFKDEGVPGDIKARGVIVSVWECHVEFGAIHALVNAVFDPEFSGLDVTPCVVLWGFERIRAVWVEYITQVRGVSQSLPLSGNGLSQEGTGVGSVPDVECHFGKLL